MGELEAREAHMRGLAAKKVVYRLPGMETLPVRSLSYRSARGRALPMDMYYPASPSPAGVPVVLAPLAYPDPDARVRSYGPLTSWAQLIASSGMAAVVFGTERPEDDVHAVLRYLRSGGAEPGVDRDRVGLFAASANVTVALSVLMRDAYVRCAALLYGYTMDLDGATAVADMSAQAGFVNACAGRSVDDLRDDVPMFFVRAGGDRFPGLNDALDRVVQRAVARNLPLTLVNYPTGTHGFDCDEDSTQSRAVIAQVLAFLRLHLGADPG